MAQLDVLLPRVLPSLRSCPTELAKQAIQWAVRDFARNTECYEAVYITPTVIAQATYDVQALVPSNVDAQVYRVMSVQIENFTWPLDVEEYAVSMARVITLEDAVIPTVADLDITIKVVLLPNIDWNAIDSSFFNYHAEAFVSGAMSHLLTIPNKEWTDQENARKYINEYMQLKAQAINMRLRGNKHRILRTAPRVWI